MNRLAFALGSLLLSTQIVGCGGGGTTSGTNTGPVVAVPDSENPNLPAEVREQAKQEEARLRKSQDNEAKKAKP